MANIDEFREGLDKVIDVISPSKWGEAAAKAGISETSLRMMNQHQAYIESQETGGGLSDCIAGLPEGDECEITQEGMLGDIGTVTKGVLRQVFKGVSVGMGPLTYGPMSIVDAAMSAGGVQAQHREMIELMAEKDVPGFIHETITIQGREVEIFVDPSDYSLNGDELKASVKEEGHRLSEGDFMSRYEYRQYRRELKQHMDRLESQSVEEVHQYGMQEHAELLESLANDGGMNEMLHDQNNLQNNIMSENEVRSMPGRNANANMAMGGAA